MERLKPHGILPSDTEREVLVTVDGEAKWSPVPIPDMGIDDLNDVDTSTVPPTVGQALLFDGVAGQWVPGTVMAAEPPDVLPSVSASRTVRFAGGPYTVALPDGVTVGEEEGDFSGKFVVVAHWQSVPGSVVDELLAIDPTVFELLAYTATVSATPGPCMAVLGCDPRDVVTLAAGSGVCEVSLLAVADAISFRGLPLPEAILTVNNCESLARWSNPAGDGMTLGPGYVRVPPNSGDGLYGHRAMADLTGHTDLTNRPIVVVEWMTVGDDLNVLEGLQTTSGIYADESDSTTHVWNMAEIRSEDMGDGWTRTVFDVYAVPSLAFRFEASTFETPDPSEGLLIREVYAVSSPRGGLEEGLAATQVDARSLPTQENDLVLISVGATPADEELSGGDLGGTTPVAHSTAGNASLSTTTWASEITFGGSRYFRGGSIFPSYGLAIVAVSINGAGTFGPGGGGTLPAGGDEGDVLTLVDGEPVWAPPPAGGVGDGLPAGGGEGQVLTIVGGEAVWVTPATTGTYLVPLTTVIAGEPTFVWTEDNQLVYIEETL